MIVSAFADEVAQDLGVQLAVLQRHGIGHVDLRDVGGRNVVELDDRQALALRDELRAHDLSVATIASPIGKEPADADPSGLRRRMVRAAAVAHLLETDLVRVFGFYPPDDGSDWRASSLRSLWLLASCARENAVTLLLENEVRTRAASIDDAVDLLASLGDDHVRAVLDPGNALACGETPYPDGYVRLKPWVDQVHVKDLDDDGRAVPAGFGAADWPGLLDALRSDGYGGIVSLEPHLARAGPGGGFTGPTLFGEAHRAFKALVAHDGTRRPDPARDSVERLPVGLRTVRYGLARQDDADEGLLVHPDGTVLEATNANVFWAVDGVLKAPRLELGSLPSMTRLEIMQALETTEVATDVDELLTADEVFLASTSREIQPVSRLDDVVYKEAPGPLCRAARRALDDAVARDRRLEEQQR